jgi:hypothetical protein
MRSSQQRPCVIIYCFSKRLGIAPPETIKIFCGIATM